MIRESLPIPRQLDATQQQRRLVDKTAKHDEWIRLVEQLRRYKQYVEHLRSNLDLHLNLEISCGLTEGCVSVVLCVPTITAGHSLNLNKHRPGTFPIGPKQFHQNGN